MPFDRQRDTPVPEKGGPSALSRRRNGRCSEPFSLRDAGFKKAANSDRYSTNLSYLLAGFNSRRSAGSRRDERSNGRSLLELPSEKGTRGAEGRIRPGYEAFMSRSARTPRAYDGLGIRRWWFPRGRIVARSKSELPPRTGTKGISA